CLRLALGMLAALLLLSPKQMHPRFCPTHFLTALGLCLVAAFTNWGSKSGWLALLAAGLAFLGAIVWIHERAPAGWTLLVLTAAAIISAFIPGDSPTPQHLAKRLADDLSSAFLLGVATTAMLVGHSYLISPGLTIKPLMHELAALAVALLVRIAVAGTALWFWTADHDLANLNDEAVLWLPVRWLIGLLGPLGFGWMAYRTAKIRSTQSAT